MTLDQRRLGSTFNWADRKVRRATPFSLSFGLPLSKNVPPLVFNQVDLQPLPGDRDVDLLGQLGQVGFFENRALDLLLQLFDILLVDGDTLAGPECQSAGLFGRCCLDR